MKKIVYILLIAVVVFCGSLTPQSFKTSRLKDSEIFNFFQKMSNTNDGKKYSLKIENTYNFILDFLLKSGNSVNLPESIFNDVKKDCSKIWSKSRIIYFAVGDPVDCSYENTTHTILLGNSDDYLSFKKYLSDTNNNPLLISRVYRTAAAHMADLTPAKLNEFIFFVNVMNKDNMFDRIFSNGIFSIKKEFESKEEASLLLQNCQMVLGIRIPERDDFIIKKDAVDDNITQITHYDIFHVGISGYVKRVILFNNMENKIISDVNIE